MAGRSGEALRTYHGTLTESLRQDAEFRALASPAARLAWAQSELGRQGVSMAALVGAVGP